MYRPNVRCQVTAKPDWQGCFSGMRILTRIGSMTRDRWLTCWHRYCGKYTFSGSFCVYLENVHNTHLLRTHQLCWKSPLSFNACFEWVCPNGSGVAAAKIVDWDRVTPVTCSQVPSLECCFHKQHCSMILTDVVYRRIQGLDTTVVSDTI